jgi:hypothetical protein
VPRVPLLIVRLGSALALVLVATMYLLASIPFAYYHFLQFPHFWWMPGFIRFHPLLLAAAVSSLVATLRDLPVALRPWIRYVAIAGVTAAACMGATVWLPVLQSYEIAAAFCFVPIGLLGMVGGLDLVAHRSVILAAGRRHDNPSLVAAVACGGLLSAAVYLLYAGLLSPAAGISLEPVEIAAVVAASLAGHLVVFMVAALAILIPRVIAARRNWSPWVELLSVLGGTASVVAVLIRRVLLTSLILDDVRAIAIAAALAVALVLYGAALIVRGMPRTMELGEAFVSGRRRHTTRWWLVIGCAVIIIVCVGMAPRLLQLADWGTTLQKLVVCVTWVASTALVVQLRAGPSRRFSLAAMSIVVVLGVAAATIGARQPGAEASSGKRPLDIALAIERYATVDTSLGVVLDIVRPMVTDTQFFDEVRRVGDVTDDRALRAIPLRVVERPVSGSAYRPNIFIIVIDSLRPDYLSAYNRDVTFTPSIGAFADDSIVMRQAFAPYTGTALSQPALWAGGLIPRRMYVQPFSAVNNLERLLQLGQYRQYVSVDEILSVILGDWSNVVRLDSRLTHPERADEMYKFDLCSTLTELTGRLDQDVRGRAPIFFYSQPQSLHIRVLSGDKYPRYEGLRSGASVFFKPAVAALGRVDACFGELIAYLKARNLYEDSIVILTSDHGDFYGEQGRWGHAFYLAPETIRIPLIMHVPQRLRENRRWDPNAVAMLTDVTPTLYDLLGYGPVAAQELLGRPLLEPKDGAPDGASRDMYLMQSSYSRIFGLLDGRAEWLYTANANEAREEFFDLRAGQEHARSLGHAERLQYRKWLVDRIARLNAHYRPAEAVATHSAH